MAIATAESPNNLRVDSLPVIDLRYLTQSELTSLSFCSSKSFDLRRCDDVIIPKIDRSVFNESAGSRKQTYSRLRLAPRKPEISAVGRGRYNPVPKPHTNPVDDPERKENKEIVSIIRGLFGDNPDIQFKDPVNEENLEFESISYPVLPMPVAAQSQALVVVPEGVIVKRKRGRPRKDRNEIVSYEPVMKYEQPVEPAAKVRKVDEDYYENVQINENVAMEIVNKNGVVVDLAALAVHEDPYGAELSRRSVGLTTEEELLVFLRGLEGQWGSRRKKRKVVDASEFGDALPIGWKILISLKRKEGNLSLYCRRYISPTGQQFVTCKEVSSYLLPYFGFQDENHPNSIQSDGSENEINKLSSGSSAGPACKDGSTKCEMIGYDASTSSIVSVSSEHEKQNPLLGTDNLADVEIRDLLECHICKMNFDEKDAYLRHLLSSHQKTTKRPRHGNTSVCDGVIIKDGKFECQFCHKIFEERHRYNGHVGVHVRNYVRSLEQSPNLTAENNVKPSVSGVLPKISVIETPAGTNGGSAAVTYKPCNEPSLQSSVKSVSVSGVLPTLSGVEKSDDTEKGSVPLMSMPSNEGTTQNVVKPSSVSGLLPGFSEVEVPASMAQCSISLTSLPSNETTTQSNAKPLSVSNDLGTSEVGTSDNIDKVSDPVTSSPCTEGNKQDPIKSPSLEEVLPGVSEAEALVATPEGSVPPAYSPKNELGMENISKPSSVSTFLPESAAAESGSVPPASSPKNEAIAEDKCKPSSVSKFLPELAAADSVSGVEALAATGSYSVPLASSPKNEASTEDNSKPSSVSTFFPESAADSGSGVEALTATNSGCVLPVSSPKNEVTDSGCVLPVSSPKNEANSEDNSKLSSVSMFLPELAAADSGIGVEALAATDSGSVPPASSPKNEASTEDNSRPSSVSMFLPELAAADGVFGVDALTITDSGFVPPSSSPKNEASMEDNNKPSSLSMFHPEFSEAETPADNFMATVPQTSVANNELSIDSPCKPDMDSNLDGCTSKSNSGQSSPNSRSDDGIYIPLSSLANSNLEDLDSLCDNAGSGSIPDDSTSPSNVEFNVNSPCSEQDVLSNKIDEGFGGKYGEDLPNFGHNSPHSAPDSEGYSSQSALDNSNGENLDSRDNLGLGTVPENCKPSSDFGLDVGSRCREQDVQAYKIDEAGGKSGDKQDSDDEMTEAEVYRLEKNYYDMNVDLRPCLDYSSALCNDVDDGPLDIFKSKDALTSEIDGKLCKLDQTNNDLDCDSKSYFGSANALDFNLGSANDFQNNVQQGTNVNFKRNNLFPSSAVGGNVSGGNQGESSFCFSFAPSGAQKTNCAEMSKDGVFSNHVKNPGLDRGKGYGFYEPERVFGVNTSQFREPSGYFPTTLDLMSNKGQGDGGNCFFGVKNTELDKGKAYVFNEPERSFGTNIGQSNLNFFREGSGSVHRTMLQRSVADTPSSFLQPSSCYSTLDLMSNKSSSSFTTLELMPNKSPGSFSSLDFPLNKGQGGVGNFSLQKFDNMSSFDELGLDDLDPSKFGFVPTKESTSLPLPLPQEPMDISYDSVMEEALNTSIHFGWDPVLPKMNNNQHQQQQQQQQTTICMWCRIPFNHEPINLGMQSDSAVGFMCPTCKAKLSGQLNIFGH